jgi:hypothetical protein
MRTSKQPPHHAWHHQEFLLSTGQFAAANYITIFDKEEVNIYDANDTIIAVIRGTIL